MIFNKGYITAFSKQKQFVAFASKGKILDSKFTLTSELSLYDYIKDIHYPVVQTDTEYCKLLWCEKNDKIYLVTGHANGTMSLWEPDLEISFKHIKTFDDLSGDVMALDYNQSKNVICAGTTTGSIIFWNLDKIDHQYKLDISIQASISCLSWNKKVSRILCAGTACGKILVLDIRAKKIALTIQNKDIKSIYSLMWHPTCSTSIFSGSNLKNMVCFKLDANSMTHVGHHDGEVIGVVVLNNSTLVSYSENQIDYVDVDSLKIVESTNVSNICYISFSEKDPVYCSTFSDGKTQICSKICINMLPSNVHVQINNRIVSRKIYKIDDFELEIKKSENTPKNIIDLLYSNSGFTFNNRKTIGEIFLEEAIKEYDSSIDEQNNDKIVFDLSDDVIIRLIKHDFDALKNIKDRNIPLNFYLESTIFNKEEHDNNDPLLYLLDVINTKRYNTLLEKVNIKQYKVILAILLSSDTHDEVVQEYISSLLTKCKDPILNLLINNPEKYFNNRSTQESPTVIYDVREFFKNFKSDIECHKILNIPVTDKLFYEYFWFAKDHGLYELLKSVKYTDKIIHTYLNQKDSSKPKDDLRNITGSKGNVILERPIHNVLTSGLRNIPMTTRVPVQNNPIRTASSIKSSPPTDISSNFSSMTLNTPLTRPSSILSKKSSLHQNITPKPNLYPTGSNSSSASFATKPLIKKDTKSPIMPSIGGSTPHVPSDTKPMTYGQMRANASGMPSFSAPPSRSPSNVSAPIKEQRPGTSVILQEFEQMYESLKQDAGKRSNLIIGNKIKDANRRFAVFQQLDKNTLSIPIINYMSDILEVIKSDRSKGDIKNEIRNIVDMCVDVGSSQSDIWMPAVSILVQIVY